MKQNVTKMRILKVLLVVGVIVIPVLYSYFYLGAFWDPYSRLDTLPVAVVNNDTGAVINGENCNVGEELCDELKDSGELKFVFTDEAAAKKGTEGEEYYAMISIPEDFSKNIASAETDDKQMATITYSANEKKNYLASQILSRAMLEVEESVQSNVDSEIVQKLSDSINEVPNQMNELSDGLTQLQEGSGELLDGTHTLAEGANTFSDKFGQYQEGVTALKDGSDSLSTGAASLNSGLSELLEGANKLSTSTEKIGDLTTGAKSLADGAQKLNEGLIQYTAGVDTLISTVDSTSSFLKQYVTQVNPSIMKDPVFAAFITKMSDPANAQSIETLQKASTTLKQASKQISTGAAALSEGSNSLPQLKAALATLSEGLESAKAGSAQLAEGSKALSQGVDTVNTATTKLLDAADDIADGAQKVEDGTSKLNDGITEAKDGVSDAITDTNDQLNSLNGLADYAKDPVEIVTDNVVSVPNYGTAFAPYFMSLSLWVGALIMFVGIYMDSKSKFKILTENSEHKLARGFIYLVIGFAQALILAWILQYSLGLEVAHPVYYYAACCLVSMVFIAIVQFLMVYLKDVGKFLTILLLILQLTSCGGTFPMETVPNFFNVLYPYMPMTYSVGLFKEVISGTIGIQARNNTIVLLVILVVFMVLTSLFARSKNKREVSMKQSEVLEG
jgi:putative membrane protein